MTFNFKRFQDYLNKDYFRYLAAGLTAFLTDYLVLFYFNKLLGVGTGVSGAAGFITGLIASFIINRSWTFKSGKSKKVDKQGLEYIALVSINLIFTIAVLVVFDNYFSPLIIKPVVTGIITVWNYYIYKRVIFKSVDQA